MRVAFDFLAGPVLGHKRRCNLLMNELARANHEIVAADAPCDWLVVDHPDNDARPVRDDCRRLLMGSLPDAPNDYGWHPLHAPAPRTLTGVRYMLLDTLAWNASRARKHDLLVSFGGADPCRLSEQFIAQAEQWSKSAIRLIVGPNFRRQIALPSQSKHQWQLLYNLTPSDVLAELQDARRALVAWGNTAFEALQCKCKTVAVVQSTAHADEADLLGAPYVTGATLRLAERQFSKATPKLPENGAWRVVAFMEEKW